MQVLNALTYRSDEEKLPIMGNFSELKVDDSSPVQTIGIGHDRDEMEKDIGQKEELLDEYCDRVTNISPNNVSERSSGAERKLPVTKVFNLQREALPKPMKRSPLDPLKKTKLLAALKSIESS